MSAVIQPVEGTSALSSTCLEVCITTFMATYDALLCTYDIDVAYDGI